MYSTIGNLFGWEEKSGDNDTIARALQKRLKEVAGFKHVPEPLPMRNSKTIQEFRVYYPRGAPNGSRFRG